MRGWGGRRDGAGRGRVKRLDLEELKAYARQKMSRARAAQFLGTSWAVVDREAKRHGIVFPGTRHYGIGRTFAARRLDPRYFTASGLRVHRAPQDCS